MESYERCCGWKKELSERMKYAFYLNLQILRKKGFQG